MSRSVQYVPDSVGIARASLRCAGAEILSQRYRALDQHVDSFNAVPKTWGKSSLFVLVFRFARDSPRLSVDRVLEL